MWRSKRQHASQIDRLLAGESVPEMGDGVVELVDQLSSEPDHREIPGDLVTMLAREAGEAESAPSGTRNRTSSPLPIRWRRRAMLTTFLSSLIGKLAIGTVALATTTGGLAATGSLPDPAQDWAAERLGAVGIEVPVGDEAETEVEAEDEDDRSTDVLDVIEGTDPEDRDQEFGEDVADTASEGASTEGRTRAEDGADNAGENDDIAENFTNGVDESELPDGADTDGADDVELPEEADQPEGADVELPEESESGSDNADQGEGFRP